MASQAQLVALLADQGVDATQTTVSRDLDDLGAVKVRLPGGDSAYALPELPKNQIAPDDHLRRVLGEWVVEVAHSGFLVVLRTPPGSAHVVGSALDRSGLEGIVGTVAGDDTVLVVASERTRWRAYGSPLARSGGHCRAGPDRLEWEGRRRCLNGWCWPTAADSTRRWRCAGCRRTREWKWSPSPSTSARPRTGEGRTGTSSERGLWRLVPSRPWWLTLAHEMAEQFCVPALQANARYEGKYPLVSALSRPVIVGHLVREARRHGATAVAPRLHGQGERPGPLRSRRPGTGAGPLHLRAGPRLGAQPRRLRRLGGEMGDTDHGDQGEALLHR